MRKFEVTSFTAEKVITRQRVAKTYTSSPAKVNTKRKGREDLFTQPKFVFFRFKMRKCCCCISVHVGATILGLIGFLICALELAVLVPYLFEIDPEVFNPVQQNLEDFYFVLEKTLKENQIDKDTIDEVLKNLKEYLWPTFLGMFSNFYTDSKK